MILIPLINNRGEEYYVNVSTLREILPYYSSSEYGNPNDYKAKIIFQSKDDIYCKETPQQIYNLILKAEKLFTSGKKVSRYEIMDLEE